jgi:hypothetical protein
MSLLPISFFVTDSVNNIHIYTLALTPCNSHFDAYKQARERD